MLQLGLRQNGTKFAFGAVSFYLARSYIRERLEDLKERVEQERVTRAKQVATIPRSSSLITQQSQVQVSKNTGGNLLSSPGTHIYLG